MGVDGGTVGRQKEGERERERKREGEKREGEKRELSASGLVERK